MPVICLSRQFGSGGAPIGRALADRFGALYLDREIVARAAARAGIPEAEAEGYDERLPGLWQRIATALASSAPEVAVPAVPLEGLVVTAIGERLTAITRLVIEEEAASGNAVIVGRGAGFILAGRPDVLRVQLHASMEARLAYLRARVEELPPDSRPDDASLEALCRSIDEARKRYVKRHFDADWMDLRNYDLCLDSGRLGLSRCVDVIEAAARHVAAVSTGAGIG
jgi:cytidylate kinase